MTFSPLERKRVSATGIQAKNAEKPHTAEAPSLAPICAFDLLSGPKPDE
jgi:hypothetical protein